MRTNDSYLDMAFGFMEYERRQKRTVLGGNVMYDVLGEYKYITLPELFNYYMESQKLF